MGCLEAAFRDSEVAFCGPIVDRGKADGDRVSVYVLGIVRSNAFRQRGRVALPE